MAHLHFYVVYHKGISLINQTLHSMVKDVDLIFEIQVHPILNLFNSKSINSLIVLSELMTFIASLNFIIKNLCL